MKHAKRGACARIHWLALPLSLFLTATICLGAGPNHPGVEEDLAAKRKPVETSVKLSTGVAQAFQLTLGGLFGDGVAQQNAMVVDVKNAVRQDSTLRFTAWNTIATGDRGHDWLGAVNYLQPIAQWETGKLTANLGFHVWHFPSVLNGRTDTVIDSGLIWTQNAPFAFTLDANVKTLATGPGRAGVGGQIYYFRGTTSHPLVRKNKLSLALIHGPSYTYANRFYGCTGHRVIRYEGGAVMRYGGLGIEAMFRPQIALQRGIRENQFWSANVFYVFD